MDIVDELVAGLIVKCVNGKPARVAKGKIDLLRGFGFVLDDEGVFVDSQHAFMLAIKLVLTDNELRPIKSMFRAERSDAE